MKRILFILFLILTVSVYGQTEGHVYPAQIVEGDTIPQIRLQGMEIASTRTWKSKHEYKKYLRLQKKVVKVYPFAHLANVKLEEYAQELALIESPREKRKFYKRIEKEIVRDYEGELRNLTISEGRILIKLLDRETGNTSYYLVEELRGKFSAFFWQGMARIFGHNLKSEYDPYGEDRHIEFIVQRIEMGAISLN